MTYQVTPFLGELSDLPLYLQDELSRIAETFSQRGGAASLFETIPQPLVQVGTTPVPLVFTGKTPVRYEVNIEGELPTLLWLQTPGIWAIGYTVEAAVETQGEYQVRLYLGGNPTNLVSTIDPSNQSAIITFTAIGTQRIDILGQRASLELRVNADQDFRDFRLLSGFFSAWWASD